VIVILAVIAAAVGWFAAAEPMGSIRQAVLALVGLVALLLGAYLAWYGRRP
jgi:hypothetical protein